MQSAFFLRWAMASGLIVSLCHAGSAADPQASSKTDPYAVAAQIDQLIEKQLQAEGTPLASSVSDEDFLRRVQLDLAGTLPTPNQVTLFGLNPDPQKRRKLVEELLKSDAYAQNWSHYWRDVVYSRVTEPRARIGQQAFESWMAEQFQKNSPWNKVAQDMITASGEITEQGATALISAQSADAAEVASEVSRIFLGIQIQCANCHDHPTDKWKREDFHQLAAFFPRMRLQQNRDSGRLSFELVSVNGGARGRGELFDNPELIFTRLDRNKNGQLTKSEVEGSPLAQLFERILQFGDKNKDGAISKKEFAELPRPDGQRTGSQEYYMPDLMNPASRGTQVNPLFFVSLEKQDTGMGDMERRLSLAKQLTSPKNPWFAKAYINRIWGEMLGSAFYMPIDDIGPERVATYPEVIEVLSEGWVASGYDVQWLFKVIANSNTYQRNIRSKLSVDEPKFAAAEPTRLRGDQIFDAIGRVLGVNLEELDGNRGPAVGPYARLGGIRMQFNAIFGYDPSTPQDEIIGNIPQALFLMNSPLLNSLTKGQGNTRLGQILAEYKDDTDAVTELYLLVLSRDPSKKELDIALEYIESVRNRPEAFEDLLWSLLNSSEFLSKR